MILFKRITKLFLLLLVLVPSASQALIPLLVGASFYFATDAAIVNALGAAAVIIGSALVWVSFGTTSGQPNTVANAPLRVQLNYLAPAPAPSGWSPAPAGSVDPIPPDVSLNTPLAGWRFKTSMSTPSGSVFVFGRPTAEDAALKLCLAFVPGSLPVSVQQIGAEEMVSSPVVNTPQRTFSCRNAAGAAVGTGSVINAFGCESGYEYDGQNCSLVRPEIVKKPVDLKCDVYNVGSFGIDPLDPDCESMTEATVTPQRVEVKDQGNAVAGGRVMTTPDGKVTVVNEARNVSTNTVTYEYYVAEEGVDSSGNATYTVVEKGAGTGRGPGYDGTNGNGTGTGTGGTGTGGTGTGGTGTCGGANQPACASGGQAVCGRAPLPPCEVNLGAQTTAPGDPTAPTNGEIDGLLQLPSLAGFKTFSLPGHTSTCPKPTFSAFGRTHTIEEHCTLLDSHTAALRAAMALVFGISAIFIVLRA